ncbi:MAG: aminoacyl-tRNA hydrolase [Chloroflexaceae bacterium]|nr:aminoacyl-tRNA hydrolase [Chloroflexaceae bacterium]
MWLIVGLGNPGEQYARTRHNIGFQCVMHLAQRHGLSFSRRREQSRIAEGTIQGERVVLAMPQTYMNRSGYAISGLRSWYKVPVQEHLLVIYDEMDLPFGRLRLRPSGSAGTHNGMRSVVQQLGSQTFPRLRVGIGKPPREWDTIAYVLGNFRNDEERALPSIYDHVADAVELVLREGVVAAMNRYNNLATGCCQGE